VPSISVVTVARNAAGTIRDCLRSVASQSAPPVEHLVIDGASDDGTCEAARAAGVHVVSEPDRGLYDAMNKGLARATADVVGFLNADDVYAAPDVLARVADALSDPAADACYGDLEYVDGADASRVTRRWKAGPYDVARFRWGWMPPHPTFFVRRDVYERLGGFDLRFGSAADYELMLRFLVRHRIPARYVPSVLVRMRTGGVSNRSLGNRVAANRMDRLAWKANGLTPLPWTGVAKPLRKLGQFLPLAVSLCAASPLHAQVSNASTSPLPTTPRVLAQEEALRQEALTARFHLGRLRFRPRLALGNVGYTSDVAGSDENPRGDWTGSIGGGGIFYLPLGRLALVRSEQLASYTWYLHNAERRVLGGTSRTVLYTFLRRATLEWTGDIGRETAILSSEFERPVSARRLRGAVRGEYEMTPRLFLLASLDAGQRRYDTSGYAPELAQQLRDLDGSDLVASAGLRVAFSRKLLAALNYERSESTYVRSGARRDHHSDGVLLSLISRPGNRLGAEVYAGVRSFRDSGSSFPARTGLSGGASLSYRVTRHVGVQVFGRSSVVDSLSETSAYFVEDRVGGGMFATLRRFSFTAAYETGRNKYESAGGPARRDDVQTVLGFATVPLYKSLNLRVDGSRSQYTSNVPGADRSVYRIGTTVTFGNRELIR
jgi:glycosyltransferase